jgi:hypothetical protein
MKIVIFPSRTVIQETCCGRYQLPLFTDINSVSVNTDAWILKKGGITISNGMNVKVNDETEGILISMDGAYANILQGETILRIEAKKISQIGGGASTVLGEGLLEYSLPLLYQNHYYVVNKKEDEILISLYSQITNNSSEDYEFTQCFLGIGEEEQDIGELRLPSQCVMTKKLWEISLPYYLIDIIRLDGSGIRKGEKYISAVTPRNLPSGPIRNLRGQINATKSGDRVQFSNGQIETVKATVRIHGDNIAAQVFSVSTDPLLAAYNLNGRKLETLLIEGQDAKYTVDGGTLYIPVAGNKEYRIFINLVPQTANTI